MKTITFVRNEPNPRIINQILSLKDTKKFKVKLLCRKYDKLTLSLYHEILDEIRCFKPPVLDLNNYGFGQNVKHSPKMHHLKNIFTGPMEKATEKITERKQDNILKNHKSQIFNSIDTYDLTRDVIKKTKKPVIIDLQDGTIVAGVKNLDEQRRKLDKYCFENAAGIIHRGPEFEINYYKKNGYKINCPIISYQDYCNKKFFIQKNPEKLSDQDGETHIVSMGSGMNHYSIPKLIKRITKQKIHFHLYLVPYSSLNVNIYDQCYQLNKTNRYFHLEKTVPFSRIHEELSKYDYGAMILTSEYTIQYQKEYKKTCLSYRLFNWFEAGLPVIMTNWYEYMSDIINKNKVGFSISENEIDELKNIIEKQELKSLINNVYTFREKYEITKNNKKLINFYDEIISNN